MRAVDILRKKRDGLPLDAAEIEAFVRGVTADAWPEYQASALLMAMFLRGLSPEETAHLTRAMVHSGVTLDLSDVPGPKVDKHSTGGVGDKTSLILAPLAAACGAIVPMISGRGLGHTGGTLDKLEAIPGFSTALTLNQFRVALRRVGCALIGQTAEIAPADRRLYALRDVTATVESIPLITASIMSKKIAEGIGALVLDVKCGRGAFMKGRANAEALARSLVATGREYGLPTRALLTAMDAPLGRAVGNALEVRECLAVLRGEGPADTTELSVTLAAHMLGSAGLAESAADAEAQVRRALVSGRGLERFRAVVAEQGGDPRAVDDPRCLPLAPNQVLHRAERPGYVTGIHAELVGLAAMLLGAGRDRAEAPIDPGVGVVITAPVGTEVRPGDTLAEVHYRATLRLPEAMTLLRQAWTVGDAPPPPAPLLLDVIDTP